jgi:uncharacterized phage protein (TIGR02220 family)
MTRPRKQTVDYFPHDAAAGKTIFILESRWGNDGYAFWFKLLETLCLTEGHVLNYRNPETKEFVLAKTRVSEQVAEEILKVLSSLGKIDQELYNKNGLVWCQNLVDNVADAYKRRIEVFPKKPVSDNGNPQAEGFLHTETPLNEQKPHGNPQSKVKYSITPPISPLQGEPENNPASQTNGTEDSHQEHIRLHTEAERIIKQEHAQTEAIAIEAVYYLNKRSGRKFNVFTPLGDIANGLVKHARARIGEGATLDHLKLVIDFKVWEWKERDRGPTAQDMSGWLRPKTLFSENFWTYIEEATTWKMKKTAKDQVRRQMAESGKKEEIIRKELDAATIAEVDRRKAALKAKYGTKQWILHIADPGEGYTHLTDGG